MRYEHIRTWEQDGFRLELFDTGTLHHGGPQQRLAYEFYDQGELIFEGSDYGCSPMHCIDSDESVAGLLAFLSLRFGDTDREYFDDYTPRQIAWMESRAEELSLCAYEIENPEN